MATWKQEGRSGSADFDEFYTANFGSLAAQVYAYCGEHAEAQDHVQEAFCRAWQRWSAVSQYDNPVAWVRKVAFNLAINRWHRMRTALNFARRERVAHAPDLSPDRIAVMTALSTLPPRQRRVAVLYYFADMSVGDIAEHEGVAAGTVKSWLHRARTSMATGLNEDTETLEEVSRRD